MNSSLAMMPKDAMKRAADLARKGVYQPPYPWDVPPPGHIPRHLMASIAAPSFGIQNQVEILNFTVPAGMWFVVKAIMFRYDGQNFVEGSGDVIFTWDLNAPNTFGQGSNLVAGHAIPDYGQIPFNLGSFDDGAFPLPSSPIFYANERIGMKGYTLRNVATGAPNRFNAMMIGWQWSLTQ